MTDEQERRAVAWLDAHPAYERAVTQAVWSDEGTWLLTTEVRAALVAFLTTPLPCATCGGRGELFGDSMSEVGVPGGEIAYAPCVACGGHLPDTAGSGTAGILLDQLLWLGQD